MSADGEDRVQHQVGEDVEGDGHVVGEGLDVEADGFFAGEGVEVAADGVHFAGDVLGGAGAGSLEDHVFDEVGDAVGFGGFAAGAGLDPDAHGDGAQMFHALGQNDEAVGQNGAAKVSFVVIVSVRFDCRLGRLEWCIAGSRAAGESTRWIDGRSERGGLHGT